MIVACAVLSSLLTGAAGSVTGQISFDGAPSVGATVQLFTPIKNAIEGCESTRFNPLGACACAGPLQDKLLEKLIAGLPAPTPVASATTGADGRYKLTAPGAGPWVLIATSAEGTASARSKVSVGAHDLALSSMRPLRVVIKGTSPRAWLLDQDTGAVLPLVQDKTELVLASPGSGHQRLIAHAEGAFLRFESMWQGELSEFRFKKGTPTLELVGPRQLQVAVTRGGQPVEAEVLVNEGTCPRTITTDASGVARFPAQSSAPSFHARREGFMARGWSTPAPDQYALDLVPTATLEVTAATAAGRPASGATLDICPFDKLDARGHALCTGLFPGKIAVGVQPPWFLVTDGVMDIEAGLTKRKLVVIKGVTLSGQVRDAKGFPVPFANIESFFGERLSKTATPEMRKLLFEGRRAYTDSEGRFELAGVPAGDYQLTARTRALGDAKVTANAPGSVVIKLDDSRAVSGTVTDASGSALPDIRVAYSQPGSSSPHETRTDAAGKFRLVISGTKDITVYADRGVVGIPRFASEAFAIDKPITPLQIVFPVVTVTRGTVVDAKGKPLANVKVSGVHAKATAAGLLVPMYQPPATLGGPAKQMPKDLNMFLFQARVTRDLLETTTDAQGAFELPISGDAVVVIDGMKDEVRVTAGTTPKIVVTP